MITQVFCFVRRACNAQFQIMGFSWIVFKENREGLEAENSF